ncbi:MAG: iron ABC transporter permease [Cyanobacteria bacterium]|nr:iron ABC transporter permease [Cyanobacteriota bacterium]MDW8200044.1 iron ABC transporter permease [Cyanobacteriota bacterium SKYGB_h_bin112]
MTKAWKQNRHLMPFGRLGWMLAVGAIALVLSAPILVVLGSLFTDARAVWQHLAATVLWRYITNSLLLVVGVGIGVLTIGAGTAWLTTLCRFPGGRLFEWLLLLPLAAPAYVLAYTYTEWLDVAGPVQQWLRNLFQWHYGDYWFPNVRSLWGAILMLTLVLYPYVYLLARVAFLQQSTTIVEASRTLGCNPWQSFRKVALPLARPAITAGLALALMETLGDFGTVQHFSVDTFTTGIYRVWLALDERQASMQMSAVLLLSVLWLIWLERWSRGQARYYQTTSRHQHLSQYHLHGWRGWGASLVCAIPIVLGFLLPAGLLVWMAFTSPDADRQFWQYARNSLVLALIAASITTAIALILGYGERLHHRTPQLRIMTSLAGIGYAIPGSVIAVGIMIPINRFNAALSSTINTSLGLPPTLLLSGIIAVIFAYVVRFLAVAQNPVESGLNTIKPSFDEAASSLGHSAASILTQVHLPLLNGSLFSAVLLVFVDVMKELPATLIIRPFNFDTLAVRTYQLAADERLAEAAPAALTIVLVGLVPVLLLSWQIRRSRTIA